MNNCVFCKIVKGEIPAAKVYEDEHILAFLDMQPIHKGHVLVIPKRHFKDITDIPEHELKEMIKATQKIAIAVEKATNAHGFNISMNVRKAAGQVIFHTHLHIIPRYEDDKLKTWPRGEPYKEKEIEDYARKISDLIKQ